MLPETCRRRQKFTGYDARPICGAPPAGSYNSTAAGPPTALARCRGFSQTAPLELGSGERWIELNGLAIDMQRQASPIIPCSSTPTTTPSRKPVEVDSVIVRSDGSGRRCARVSGRSLALRFWNRRTQFQFRIIKALQAGSNKTMKLSPHQWPAEPERPGSGAGALARKHRARAAGRVAGRPATIADGIGRWSRDASSARSTSQQRPTMLRTSSPPVERLAAKGTSRWHGAETVVARRAETREDGPMVSFLVARDGCGSINSLKAQSENRQGDPRRARGHRRCRRRPRHRRLPALAVVVQRRESLLLGVVSHRRGVSLSQWCCAR